MTGFYDSHYGRHSKGPETIRGLIAELATATEGSELLDAMIVRVLYGWWTDFDEGISGAGDQGGSSPLIPFTRSLDAKIDSDIIEAKEEICKVKLINNTKWHAYCHGYLGIGNTEILARRIAALIFLISPCELHGHQYSDIDCYAIGRCRRCGELDFEKMRQTEKKQKKQTPLDMDILRSVYLPVSLDAELRVLAFERRTSINALIRQYVTEGLRNEL